MSFNNRYQPGGFGFLPTVTKNIIIINVIMFLATAALHTQGIDLVKYLGLHYYSAPDFKPHQFVTYIFMHGSVQHILFNMLAVYIFGQVLEQVWGPKRYLIFYLLTGFGAALAQYVVIHLGASELLSAINAVQDNLTLENFEALTNSPDFQHGVSPSFYYEFNDFVRNYNSALHEHSENRAIGLASQFLIDYKNQYLNSQVVVGASGSLFGLLGAFGMLFPNTRLYLYFLFPVKAKWLVIAYGLIELFSGLRNDPMDNVAHFAHLGGLIVGIILVLIWRKEEREHFY